MTLSLYGEWIKQWDAELSWKGRKILLLQDNFSGHIVPNRLQSICIKNFKPNLTVHVQPDDWGIIWCYHAKFIQSAINCYDEGITTSVIYDINQLQAMRLTDAAWKEVDVTTVWNCWQKAGILLEFSPIPPHATFTTHLHSHLQCHCERGSRHTCRLPHSEQFPNWPSTWAHIISEGFRFCFIHFSFSILFLFSNLALLFYQQLTSLNIRHHFTLLTANQ